MRRISRFCLIILFSLFTLIDQSSVALAGGEGMYLPIAGKLPEDVLATTGIELSAQELIDLSTSAVVHYNEYCSATLLSDQGIVGTNHHCAAIGCISGLHTKYGDDDPKGQILQTGYLAKNQAEEIKCEGDFAKILKDVRNVSDAFAPILGREGISASERSQLIEEKKQELLEACNSSGADIKCNLAVMNNEEQPYYLYRFRKITDVRLVWTPPDSIGTFGGDTDNWEYPRYTGDFTFFRLYENGKPFQPERHARASAAGVKPGDPQFILGFPGRTQRNISAAEALFLQNVDFPLANLILNALASTIEETYPIVDGSPYEASYGYLQNFIKNSKIKYLLMEQLKVVDSKRAQDQVMGDSPVLQRLSYLFRNRAYYFPTLTIEEYMTSGRRSPAKSIAAAWSIYQWSKQPSDNSKRKEGFKFQDKGALEGFLGRIDGAVAFKVEQNLLAQFLRLLDSRPMRSRVVAGLKTRTSVIVDQCRVFGEDKNYPELSYAELCQTRGSDIYQQMAALVFSKTALIAKEDTPEAKERAKAYRLALFGKSQQEVLAQGDSLIAFMQAMSDEIEAIHKHPGLAAPFDEEYDTLNRQRNLVVGPETPDANSTLRLVFGTVQADYNPMKQPDQHFPFATTVSGLIARHGFLKDKTRNDYTLFQVPEAILALQDTLAEYEGQWFYDDTLQDVPVNFISNHYITGGNSGSAVYNSLGEVVGFAFDGVPESVVGDVFGNKASRTITVDMRYIGFLGSVIYPEARWILKEIGLPN